MPKFLNCLKKGEDYFHASFHIYTFKGIQMKCKYTRITYVDYPNRKQHLKDTSFSFKEDLFCWGALDSLESWLMNLGSELRNLDREWEAMKAALKYIHAHVWLRRGSASQQLVSSGQMHSMHNSLVFNLELMQDLDAQTHCMHLCICRQQSDQQTCSPVELLVLTQ